ncbi:MAG: 1-acyl-sn-glycerol-3-phosphate acyltransferase [Mycoplasmoidaceae bacterium]|nr:1-acyl-sn-glycerol-3-phosphate acyltransferase [Mycoplasmoidaceae bacterium]
MEKIERNISKKTKIMIGKPININALWSENKSIKENIIYINNYIKKQNSANAGSIKMRKVSKFKKIFDPKMFFYDILRFFGFLTGALFVRVKKIYISGKRPKNVFKGNLIICANHSTFIDPMIMMLAVKSRRICFLTTKALYKKKLSKLLFNKLNCVMVDKENINLNIVEDSINIINSGHALGIFPEATVKKTDQIRQFKSGLSLIAAVSGADILPIYIIPRKK